MRIHPFSLSVHPDRSFAFLPVFRNGREWSGTDASAVFAAVSLRSAGDMAFSESAPNLHREAYFHGLGLKSGSVAARAQTHSRDVFFLDRSYRDRQLPPGDGLATNSIGLALSVTIADCLPVLLVDTDTLSIAAVHSGWKGTGIVQVALDLLTAACGARADRVCAVFGPSIHACCYRVDHARVDEFRAMLPTGGLGGPLGPAVRQDGGDWFLDLPAANARILEDAGVGDLAVCGDCTFTDDRLGSYRREGPLEYTRMAAVIATSVRGDA